MASLAVSLYVAVFFAGRWGPRRVYDPEYERIPVTENLYRLTGEDLPLEVRLYATLAIIALTAFCCLRTTRFARDPALNITLLISCFYAYMGTSALWSVDHGIAAFKLYEVCVSLALIWTFYVWQQRSDIRGAFVRGAVGIALLMAALALAGVAQSSTVSAQRLAVLGGGVNVFGRIMGFLALAALFYSVQSKRAIAWLVVAALALVLLAASGSRGAMFATAFGLLVLITALGSRMLRMGLGLLILIPVFAAAVSFTRIGQYASDVFQFRLITLTFEERYTSGREEFPSETVSTWARSPVFGVGLSSYSLMSRTDQSYPHNLFFEVIAEGGVVGALLLLLPFGYTIGLLVTRRVKADPLILSMLGLFLAASQFSGDLYDSRGVLLFLQMALLRPPVDPESRIDGIRA